MADIGDTPPRLAACRPTPSGLRLPPLLSVETLAKRAGSEWSYRRMLHHLQTCDRQLGGILLVKHGSGRNCRYSVTEDAIANLHPQWVASPASITARLSDLENKLIELDEMVVQAHQEIERQKGTNAALTKRLEMAERNRRVA